MRTILTAMLVLAAAACDLDHGDQPLEATEFRTEESPDLYIESWIEQDAINSRLYCDYTGVDQLNAPCNCLDNEPGTVQTSVTLGSSVCVVTDCDDLTGTSSCELSSTEDLIVEFADVGEVGYTYFEGSMITRAQVGSSWNLSPSCQASSCTCTGLSCDCLGALDFGVFYINSSKTLAEGDPKVVLTNGTCGN